MRSLKLNEVATLPRTVLFDKHKELGARMTVFGGWEMPVQYTGIIDEHNTVRNYAGLFDVSHMGQVFVYGKDALQFLQKIVPQDISLLKENKAVYCQLTYENGGIVDDLIIYNINKSKYLVIVNAANIEKDINWLLENAKPFDVIIDNMSNEYSMLALQGPNAVSILENCGINIENQPSFFTITETYINNVPVYLSRTGYTGEDGFEIITKNAAAPALWDLILSKGKSFGIKPAGLGARDTLRLEAALPLYGNDINADTTPVEAGLKWSIPLNKNCDYNGKDTIISQIQTGVQKKIVGFKMIERAIPRHGYEIYINNTKAGYVTSGGYAPTINENIGMGYIDTSFETKLDSKIQIMVRNKLYNAAIVKRPFIKKRYKIS